MSSPNYNFERSIIEHVNFSSGLPTSLGHGIQEITSESKISTDKHKPCNTRFWMKG